LEAHGKQPPWKLTANSPVCREPEVWLTAEKKLTHHSIAVSDSGRTKMSLDVLKLLIV
jgi:hypothetical protein